MHRAAFAAAIRMAVYPGCRPSLSDFPREDASHEGRVLSGSFPSMFSTAKHLLGNPDGSGNDALRRSGGACFAPRGLFGKRHALIPDIEERVVLLHLELAAASLAGIVRHLARHVGPQHRLIPDGHLDVLPGQRRQSILRVYL